MLEGHVSDSPTASRPARRRPSTAASDVEHDERHTAPAEGRRQSDAGGAERPAGPRDDVAKRPPLIDLRNLHKAFGTLKVLDGISLKFQSGRTTVILGPSGTGKSVLLKHIVGLLRPDGGEVHFEGQRIDHLREPQLVAFRKQVGFLFQGGALFDSKNVHDNVCFPLVEHTKMSRSEKRDRCDTVLKMVGLGGFEKKMPAELSGGQRKRVALARAIVLEPKLILYDEPTTGLDPITSDVINELIVALAETLGVTSVAVTHDIASAKKIGDRMVMLDDGRVLADAAKQAFLACDIELVQRFLQGRAREDELREIHDGIRTASRRFHHDDE